MLLDFSTLQTREAYGWMTSTVLPRPIAWVSSVSPEGRPNLAPFSYFQAVTASPPTLLFVPANDRHGNKKDTLRNVEQVPEFVVNLVSYALAEKMNACSASLPYGESEFETFGIASAPSARVRPPRVADAPVAFECVLHTIVRVGEGPLAANVVFGRILAAHVKDEVLGPEGRPDPKLLDLVGRLGGESYARLGEVFSLRRP